MLRLTLLTDMQNERAQAMYRRVGFVGSPMKPMRLKIKKVRFSPAKILRSVTRKGTTSAPSSTPRAAASRDAGAGRL